MNSWTSKKVSKKKSKLSLDKAGLLIQNHNASCMLAIEIYKEIVEKLNIQNYEIEMAKNNIPSLKTDSMWFNMYNEKIIMECFGLYFEIPISDNYLDVTANIINSMRYKSNRSIYSEDHEEDVPF
jgi:hypothetical protein